MGTDSNFQNVVEAAHLDGLNRHNLQLSAANATLRAKIAELEGKFHSARRSYVNRIVQDVLYGDMRTRARLLPELLGKAAEHILPALQRVPAHVRFLKNQSFTHFYNRFSPYGPILLPGHRQNLYKLLKKSKKRKIALSLSGGLGDGIWLSAVTAAIRRKYVDAEIYVVTNNAQYAEVFANNRCIAGIIGIAESQESFGLPWMMHLLLRSGRLDIWFECKYVTKVHYGRNARVDRAEKERTAAAFAKHSLNFREFPLGNNLLSLYGERHHMNLLTMVGRSALLDLRDQQLFIVPSEADMMISAYTKALGAYVTIHHGCDPRMAGQEAKIQTKNWFYDRWEAVIDHIRKQHGLRVIQLGTSEERPLRGADHSFLGRTTVNQAAILLKNARLHLDTEGGMVHLARAMHTPSLVLFGPTPVSFFSYPGNTNVLAGNCHSCWWSTLDWARNCPRGLPIPSCMDSISTDAVCRSLDERLFQKPLRWHYTLLNLTLFHRDFLRERQQILEALGNKGHIRTAKNWNSLYAIEQIQTRPDHGALPLRILHAGAGQDSLLLYLAGCGHKVEICDIDFSANFQDGLFDADATDTLKTIAAHGVDFCFGSLLNLPYDGETFDVVCCSALLRHSSYKEAVLRELLRVVRPGGILVWTLELGMEFAKSSLPANMISETELCELLESFEIDPRPYLSELESSQIDVQNDLAKNLSNRRTLAGACIRKLAPT